jgi:hypothetical protein
MGLYDRLIVDCPALRLSQVTLRTVERIVQQVWRTNKSIAFRLHESKDGHLTVIESIPA